MIPNAQIYYNGTDVSEYVISYNREQLICSGVATCSVTLKREFLSAYSPVPYGIFTIYESSIKVGKFYISTYSHSHTAGVITIECQDESKKMVDYFVSTSYSIEYLSYGRYWIEKFLNEAGVSYQFDVEDSGSVLSNNTTLGYASCYELVTTLVQQSGWHFIADAEGVIHVGKLDIDVETHDIILPGTHTILSIVTSQDDSILRNRVVVWGSANEDNQAWVFAEARVYSPYNYDTTDLRTAVLSNGNIYTNGQAKLLATRILKETNHIRYVKELEIAGFVNTIVGESAFVDTPLFEGWGLITSIAVNVSTQGVITTIRLDERCPRIYAYFGYRTNYVYIGTDGAGVWRKPFTMDGWTNYSTGLTDLNVTDLAVNKSTLACVTSDGSLFKRRTIDGSWYKLAPNAFTATLSGTPEMNKLPTGITEEDAELYGLMYTGADVECKAVDINKNTNEIIAVHTLRDQIAIEQGTLVPVVNEEPYYVAPNIDSTIPEESWVEYNNYYWHSWVTKFTSTSQYETEEIIVNGSADVHAYDVATDGTNVYIVCLAKIPTDPPRRWTETIRQEGWQSLAFPADSDTAIVSTDYEIINAIGATDVTTGITALLKPDKLPNLDRPEEYFKYNASLTGTGVFTVNIYKIPLDGSATEVYATFNTEVAEYPALPLAPLHDVEPSDVISPELSPSVHLTDYRRGDGGTTMNLSVIYEVDYYDLLYYYETKIYYIFGLTDGVVTYQHSAEVTTRGPILPGPTITLVDTKTGDTAFDMEDTFEVVSGLYPIVISGLTYGTFKILNPLTRTVVATKQLKLPTGADYVTDARTGTWTSIAFDRDGDDSLCYGNLWLGDAANYQELFAFDPATATVHRRYLTGNPHLAGPDGSRLSYYSLPTLRYIYKNALYFEDPNNNTNLLPFYELVPTIDYEYQPINNTIVHGVARRTDQGDYILLAQTPILTHIEASLDDPLVAFGGNAYLGYGFVQIFPGGYRDNTINVYTHLGVADPVDPNRVVLDASYDVSIPEIADGQILIPSYVPDARVFDWVENGVWKRYVAFTKVTPTQEEGGEITMNGSGKLYMIDYFDNVENNLLTPIYVNYIEMDVTEGFTLTKLEATNSQDIPYIFASTNDIPAMFYEKEGMMEGEPTTGFAVYTTNLPSYSITCIRADDKI